VALSHDLSDVKGIQNFAKELAEMEPCVNILVNNSGTTWGEPIETYPEAGPLVCPVCCLIYALMFAVDTIQRSIACSV
jgi:NAD(P)-dependent dehydrogenase (short-subunit alcohol dehydrogenase family)